MILYDICDCDNYSQDEILYVFDIKQLNMMT